MTQRWTDNESHTHIPADNVEAERQRAEWLVMLQQAEHSTFETQAEPGIYGGENRHG